MELRGQLSLYSEKFEEFQKTLTRSNEVFGTFKKEMDKVKTSSIVCVWEGGRGPPGVCVGGVRDLLVCVCVGGGGDLHSTCHLLQMSKTITVLEKEMVMWRSKYEKCNKALIDTAEEV